MIPKIIHYCWFGGNTLPDDALKYIESWKNFCPDYEIIEWNEKNFDINCCEYVKEAYDAKKWAFITDYVRIWALYNFGGIYMDTDVEVIKPLDDVLDNEAFSGFESSLDVPTGIMGSVKGHAFMKKLLDYYDGKHFLLSNGQYDMQTNVVTITNIAVENGLKRNNKKQTIYEMTFYPSDFFCPKSHKTREMNVTENTMCIHHFSGSWLTSSERKVLEIRDYFSDKGKLGKVFGNVLNLPLQIYNKLKKYGFVGTIKYIAAYLKNNKHN